MKNKINKNTIIIIILVIIVILFIMLKLKMKDNATLQLNGNDNMIVYQNDEFVDPGYRIINNSNDENSGYYVNIDKNINTNVMGNYYIKYMLYDKNGKLLSEVTRQVIVIENTSINLVLSLKGENEEYYFKGDYIDQGAIAELNNKDISSRITIESNVKENEIGDYEVKYQVKENTNIKEVVRVVHIIDFDIQEDVDTKNSVLTLNINCDNYDYTILPNNSKEYNSYIKYNYQEIKKFEFDIYLKSGSHKKYTVDIGSIDKNGPVGTCTVYYEKNKTNIVMDVTDSSGVKKYSYNGLDFYNANNSLDGLLTNLSIRAYDNIDNFTDIKCQAKYSSEFKNIENIKKQYVPCGTDFSKVNSELDALMQSYGYKTRDAVAAAALYLADYEYAIGYRWGGKYVEKGFDDKWGCSVNTSPSNSGNLVCSNVISESSNKCQGGLDCAGYTSWAFAQAGFDKEIIRKSSQSTGMWGNFNAQAHKYTFSKNQDKVNQIKPGDIVHIQHATTGHVGIVIGVSDTTLQVANEHAGIKISIIRKSDGKSTNKDEDFTDFVLFDDFYEMYGN